MKIFFGFDIPYQSTKVDTEATDKLRKEMEARGEEWFFFHRVVVPCIRYRDLFFEICDHCGNQVPRGRVSRGLTDCSPACHKVKRDGWCASTLKAERELVGARPTFFWWKIRDECFERDGYTCQRCKKEPVYEDREYNFGTRDKPDIQKLHVYVGVPLEAHHILPIAEGGTNELSNLITLCYDCHKLEHSKLGKTMRAHKTLDNF